MQTNEIDDFVIGSWKCPTCRMVLWSLVEDVPPERCTKCGYQFVTGRRQHEAERSET